MKEKKLLSIVIPAYLEQENLRPIYQSICKVMDSNLSNYQWEIIFVDDGSTDHSAEILSALSAEDKRCSVIELSRNFGKEISLTAGVDYARGDAVICLDADLQHPPSRIPDMVREWELGYEVVEMIRAPSKHEPLFRQFGSKLFYLVLRSLSNTDIMAKTTDFRLLDKKVVKAFRKVKERQRMFRGIIDWLGFRKVRLTFIPNPRKRGLAVYSMAKLTNLAFNSFISYSSIPLKLVGLFGLIIVCLGSFLMIWMLSANFFAREEWNFTPLAFAVVTNLILTGITLTALGLISLYISKIYSEVQNRPLYTIRRILNYNK